MGRNMVKYPPYVIYKPYNYALTISTYNCWNYVSSWGNSNPECGAPKPIK
jgi:hypothetical protein